MKTVKLLAAAAFCVSFSSLVSARQPAENENYFKTSAVTLTSEETTRDLTDKDTFPVPMRSEEKVVGAAAIVNGGAQAWNAINSGAPNANLSSSYASAIPGLSFNWAKYSGWKKKSVVYTYTVTNLMQVDVIKIKYEISYYYNGQDLSGVANTRDNPLTAMAQSDSVKGHFITNFTVRPLVTNIKWGWKFALNVRMSDPMNIASAQNPVAYMQSDLNYIVSTPFSTNGGMWAYSADGLGNFRDLTAQEKALTGDIAPVQVPGISPVSWN